MTAEIIAVGTELLLGDILNTNAQFLSQQLAQLGVTVHFQSVVGDNPARLESVVRLAMQRSDLLVFSGGLGPTDDDLTKQTVARAFEAVSYTHLTLPTNREGEVSVAAVLIKQTTREETDMTEANNRKTVETKR